MQLHCAFRNRNFGSPLAMQTLGCEAACPTNGTELQGFSKRSFVAQSTPSKQRIRNSKFRIRTSKFRIRHSQFRIRKQSWGSAPHNGPNTTLLSTSPEPEDTTHTSDPQAPTFHTTTQAKPPARSFAKGARNGRNSNVQVAAGYSKPHQDVPSKRKA